MLLRVKVSPELPEILQDEDGMSSGVPAPATKLSPKRSSRSIFSESDYKSSGIDPLLLCWLYLVVDFL